MKENYEEDCRRVYQTFLEEVAHRQGILDKQKRNYENILFAGNEEILKAQERMDNEYERAKIKIVSKVSNPSSLTLLGSAFDLYPES